MSFAEAKLRKSELEAEVERTGRALRAISGGGPLGMTPDHVRATAEWSEAKRAFDSAFAALRAFNEDYVPRFRSEIARERREKRGMRA